MARKPKTIDEYLATLSDDKRAALQKLTPAKAPSAFNRTIPYLPPWCESW